MNLWVVKNGDTRHMARMLMSVCVKIYIIDHNHNDHGHFFLTERALFLMYLPSLFRFYLYIPKLPFMSDRESDAVPMVYHPKKQCWKLKKALFHGSSPSWSISTNRKK